MNRKELKAKKGKCTNCGKLAYLSGLGTCPDCVKEWIKDYKSYHKSKRSHYAR